MWADGATAKRWIGIPEHGTIEAVKGPFSKIPENTVLAKTLSRGGRRIETQLLHYADKLWQGYSYRWNEQEKRRRTRQSRGRKQSKLRENHGLFPHVPNAFAATTSAPTIDSPFTLVSSIGMGSWDASRHWD